MAHPCGSVTQAPVLALAWPFAVTAVPPRGALCGKKKKQWPQCLKRREQGPNTLEKSTMWIHTAISAERKQTALLAAGLCQAGTVDGFLIRFVAQSCSKAPTAPRACKSHTRILWHELIVSDVTHTSQPTQAPASHAQVPLPSRWHTLKRRNTTAAPRCQLFSRSQRKPQKTLLSNLMANKQKRQGASDCSEPLC